MKSETILRFVLLLALMLCPVVVAAQPTTQILRYLPKDASMVLLAQTDMHPNFPFVPGKRYFEIVARQTDAAAERARRAGAYAQSPITVNRASINIARMNEGTPPEWFGFALTPQGELVVVLLGVISREDVIRTVLYMEGKIVSIDAEQLTVIGGNQGAKPIRILSPEENILVIVQEDPAYDAVLAERENSALFHPVLRELGPSLGGVGASEFILAADAQSGQSYASYFDFGPFLETIGQGRNFLMAVKNSKGADASVEYHTSYGPETNTAQLARSMNQTLLEERQAWEQITRQATDDIQRELSAVYGQILSRSLIRANGQVISCRFHLAPLFESKDAMNTLFEIIQTGFDQGS